MIVRLNFECCVMVCFIGWFRLLSGFGCFLVFVTVECCLDFGLIVVVWFRGWDCLVELRSLGLV